MAAAQGRPPHAHIAQFPSARAVTALLGCPQCFSLLRWSCFANRNKRCALFAVREVEAFSGFVVHPKCSMMAGSKADGCPEANSRQLAPFPFLYSDSFLGIIISYLLKPSGKRKKHTSLVKGSLTQRDVIKGPLTGEGPNSWSFSLAQWFWWCSCAKTLPVQQRSWMRAVSCRWKSPKWRNQSSYLLT